MEKCLFYYVQYWITISQTLSFLNLPKIKTKYVSLCDFSISTVESPLSDHPQGICTGKWLLNGGNSCSIIEVCHKPGNILAQS